MKARLRCVLPSSAALTGPGNSEKLHGLQYTTPGAQHKTPFIFLWYQTQTLPKAWHAISDEHQRSSRIIWVFRNSYNSLMHHFYMCSMFTWAGNGKISRFYIAIFSCRFDFYCNLSIYAICINAFWLSMSRMLILFKYIKYLLTTHLIASKIQIKTQTKSGFIQRATKIFHKKKQWAGFLFFTNINDVWLFFIY